MMLDYVALAHRNHVIIALMAFIEHASTAGTTDSQLKAAILSLRAEGLLHDEEAEAVIERLGLRAA